MNWKFVRSEIWNALTMLRSDVANPGPRKEPAAQVPKVPRAGSVTERGFKKRLPMNPKVWGLLGSVNEPSPDCETPATQLGRGEALPVPDLSTPCGYRAKPECMVKFEAMLQPPMIAFAIPSALPPNLRPLPNGRS